MWETQSALPNIVRLKLVCYKLTFGVALRQSTRCHHNNTISIRLQILTLLQVRLCLHFHPELNLYAACTYREAIQCG